MFDLSIKQDKRSFKFHQRGLRNGEVSKAKRMACLDITKECGKGKFYTINYISWEYTILQLKNYWFEMVSL